MKRLLWVVVVSVAACSFATVAGALPAKPPTVAAAGVHAAPGGSKTLEGAPRVRPEAAVTRGRATFAPRYGVTPSRPAAEPSIAKPQLVMEKPVIDGTKLLVNFYLLGLMEQRARLAADKLGPSYGKWLAAKRDELVESFGPKLVDYVTQAVAGELEYASQDQAPDWLRGAVNRARSDRTDMQQAILEAARAQGWGPVEFAKEARRIFSMKGWPSIYGGPTWANIADAITRYYDGSTSKAAWVDHVFDLQHNSGALFGGKVATVTLDAYGASFLRSKLHAVDPIELLEDAARIGPNRQKRLLDPETARMLGAAPNEPVLDPELVHVLETGAAAGAWARPTSVNLSHLADAGAALTAKQRSELPSANIAWLTDVRKDDAAVVGGKGANLGEMAAANLPVPPGYVVTSHAFLSFLRTSGVGAEIDRRLAELDVGDPVALKATSEAIQSRIRQAPLPRELREEIAHAYAKIGPNARVAARSSATVEDGKDSSFAGMFRSHLDVRGTDDLVEKVKDAWASAFGARALAYARRRGKAGGDQSVAVVVMKMVDPKKSGVMFTTDPTSGKDDRIVIESTRGLGDAVVGGEVIPHRAVIGKGPFRVLEEVKSPDGAGALTRLELQQLAALARRVERHYGAPQDIEFAFEGDELYLLQTRPITKVEHRPVAAASAIRADARPLVSGVNASSGTVTGRVRVVHSASEAAAFRDGEILVADKTLPEWMPLMLRAKAIVTNSGGLVSHAAIVARELGVPAVVGAKNATERLRDGMIVTVDAGSGVIYEGDAVSSSARLRPPP